MKQKLYYKLINYIENKAYKIIYNKNDEKIHNKNMLNL